MKLIVVALAILVVLGTAGVFAASIHQPGKSSASPRAIASGSPFSAPPSSMAGAVLSQLRASHVATDYAFLPNFNARASVIGGSVAPLYDVSPAPMGIGDFGLINTSSGIMGYNTTTSSIDGSVTLNSLQPFYLLNDAPQSVGVQLNAVLNNVTLFGNQNFVFWTQNVAFYSPRTQTLTFLDNIWNFSSPTFTMTANSLYSYGGNIVAPIFYYDVGPTINVSYPFTVNLYLNSTVIGQRSAIFFNYSIASPTLTQPLSGSYDRVLFNSTTMGMPSSTVAPQYLISGTTLTPTGYLLNDAELMIGGPGGGSTTSIFNINGNMQLMLLNESTGQYASVNSAYDFGTDTGETSEGIAVSWTTNAVAYLTPGPSLLYGMWNITPASSGSPLTYSGTLTPSNAFLFVSAGGSFNNSTAAWAPVHPDGTFSFALPPGVYSGAVLMSNHDPVYGLPMAGGMSVTLSEDTSMGIYTPLFAFTNQQIALLASSGSGSESSPYMIGGEMGVVNQLFSELNDFFFPVFPGVMLVDTTAYVGISTPTPYVEYMASLLPGLEFYGFPVANYMPFEFYNVSNASVVNSPFISGWFPYFLYGFPVANLLVWNSTDILVAGNYFSSMGSSALIFNSTGVLVWGNVFAENGLAGTSISHPSRYFQYELSPIYPSPVPTGLSVFSSGDLIYNNAFLVNLPAMSPDFNIYTFGGASYVDQWNVPFTLLRNASPSSFNGFLIPATSITGGGYLGGNFWYNYSPRGSLHLPFSDNGWISYGGDYVPLVLGSASSGNYNSVLQPMHA